MPTRISLVVRMVVLSILFMLTAINGTVQAQTPELKIRLPIGLQEASGLYYQNQDSLWWHNDSGDSPTLWLTDGKGNTINTPHLSQFRNIDWEDITYDDEGWLYIGDFGDNLERRTRLQIYKYHPATARLDSIVYSYGVQANSDRNISHNAEGFFWHQDSLYIFTKDRLSRSKFLTKQFVLADDVREQTALLRDSLVLRKRVVTGAAIHHQSQTVALVTYTFKKVLGFIPYSAASIYLFDSFPGNLFLRGRLKRKNIAALIPTQFEAIDFVDDTYLYVASERTPLYKQKAKRKKWSKWLKK